MPQEQSEQTLSRLADLIFTHKHTITGRWVEAVRADREIQSSEDVTYRQLVDHLPAFLDELCEALRLGDVRGGRDQAERDAWVHGRHRWEQGYRADELLREIGILRNIILLEFIPEFAAQYTKPQDAARGRAVRIINEFFNDFTIESVRQFMEDHEREINSYSKKLERANKTLGEANEQLERAEQSRLLLTRTLAHELGNMLNGISIPAQVFIKSRDEAARRKALGILERNVQDIKGLLNQLLDYSVLVTGHQQVNEEAFEVAALCDEMAVAFEPPAHAKGLEFKAECGPGIRAIITDRVKVKQILSNLLSNAIKYTEAGHVHLSIHRLDSGHTSIAVEDSGLGIRPEHLPHIFEEFYRVRSPASIHGTGLGLAITERLVELLGGRIDVSSRPGQGSRFEVILPLKEA